MKDSSRESARRRASDGARTFAASLIPDTAALFGQKPIKTRLMIGDAVISVFVAVGGPDDLFGNILFVVRRSSVPMTGAEIKAALKVRAATTVGVCDYGSSTVDRALSQLVKDGALQNHGCGYSMTPEPAPTEPNLFSECP